MMSNYPPGVTGHEYEIAGPDAEYDDTRECGVEGASFFVAGSHVQAALSKAYALIKESDDLTDPAIRRDALYAIADGLTSLERIEGRTCPFVGPVSIEAYRHSAWWTCPICDARHDEEPDEDYVGSPY